MYRRKYLLSVAGVSAGIAGCAEETGEGGTQDNETTSGNGDGAADGTESPGDSTETPGDGTETPGDDSSETDGVTGDGETGLDVIHVAGDQVSDNSVTRIRMLVTPASEGAVDLSAVTIDWMDESGTATISHASAGGDASFEVRSVQDANGTLGGDLPVLDGLADHAELVFDVPAAVGGALEGGTTVDLTVTTAGGIESSGGLVTPQTVVGSVVELGVGIQADSGGQQQATRVTVEQKMGSTADDAVDTVTVRVLQAPGGSNVDLSQVVLRYLDPSGAYNLTHDSGSSGGATFTTTAQTDEDESAPVLNAEEDRIDIEFDVAALRGDSGLPAGEVATLHLVTPSGGTTTVVMVVPQSLSGSDEVRL